MYDGYDEEAFKRNYDKNMAHLSIEDMTKAGLAFLEGKIQEFPSSDNWDIIDAIDPQDIGYCEPKILS